MAITITNLIMRSDQTSHTARLWAGHTTGPGESEGPTPSPWRVSWLPGRDLTRNQAVTAMTLAETAGTTGDLHHGHRLWPFIDSWAAELGLTGPDAVVRASEPPDPEAKAAEAGSSRQDPAESDARGGRGPSESCDAWKADGRDTTAEPDQPEPDEYEPGPERNDEGGMSEDRHSWPDEYEAGS